MSGVAAVPSFLQIPAALQWKGVRILHLQHLEGGQCRSFSTSVECNGIFAKIWLFSEGKWRLRTRDTGNRKRKCKDAETGCKFLIFCFGSRAYQNNLYTSVQAICIVVLCYSYSRLFLMQTGTFFYCYETETVPSLKAGEANVLAGMNNICLFHPIISGANGC